MEASALHAAPAGLTRLSLGPLLRLRSDEQLVALFRAGNDEAFNVIHDRFQQRLFAYVRQMLGGSRQDAEDVLQDVFVRAYGSLRADDRPLNVRAWLYRVAHNRCIDQLRRPTPPASEIFEMSRKPLHDPIEEAQRREDLRRLVEDVSRLPEQQRSALLMREIDGMSYADLAAALDTSVPAVKSLLVRARVSLAEAVEARDMDCAVIRVDLAEAYDRGVKASGRARRHLRECEGCTEYRTALRGVQRSFAALSPLGLGPLALAAKALGIGSAGGGAAASGGAASGGAAITTGIGAASATKVAAVVCTAAIATGGAVEVKKRSGERTGGASSAEVARKAAPAAAAAAAAAAASTETAPVGGYARREPLKAAAPSPEARRRAAARRENALPTPATPEEAVPGSGLPAAPGAGTLGEATSNPTGGATAPADDVTNGGATTKTANPQATKPATGTSPSSDSQTSTSSPGATGGAGAPATGGSGDSSSPPPEH